MSKIKVIFFDIGGVFVRKAGGYVIDNLSKVLNQKNEDLENLIFDTWEDFGTGRITEDKYFENLSNTLAVDRDMLSDLWRSDELFAPDPKIESIITRLKERNYIVASITDVDPVHFKIHLEKGNYKIFEFVIDSLNVGSTKRAGKEIYLKAIEVSKAKPDECVMIDDTPEKLKPAKELGINVIHFKNTDQLREELRNLGIEI